MRPPKTRPDPVEQSLFRLRRSIGTTARIDTKAIQQQTALAAD
jgi:hypothetical protein